MARSAAIRLDDVDPGSTPDAPGDREKTEAATRELSERLAELQRRLFAEDRRSLLVVLQAMDTGGKDGAIKQIFRGVNPSGVRIASFKQPSPLEMKHDFLWRVHARVPAQGEIVVFNRSHYEAVLIERVRELVPTDVWRARYDEIKAFEGALTAAGTSIVKFFFHISKQEQAKRLLSRLDDPEKRWKFNEGDVAERQRWDAYMAAYEDAINKTSTDDAPWHVVPANKKWYRDFVVVQRLVEVLESIGPEFPARDELADFDRGSI